MKHRRHWIAACAAWALLAASHPARADDAAAVIGDATLILPLRDTDRTAQAAGGGVELRFVPHREPITGSIGGYFALGQPDGDKRLRDIYDFHVNIGYKRERSRGNAFVPYASLGLDVIVVNTHDESGTARGTTLGVNAQVGFMGFFAERWIYRASATYLGGIAPGTGDDLGSLVLQVGIGKLVGD